MINIKEIMTYGWEEAIRGMRNPMNSWDKSDSKIYDGGVFEFTVGDNDLNLMKKLANAGSDHGKFLRMITVYMDVTAPLYWWKEFDTYKVGTVANSCSTMHKIHAKEFTLDDFSCEHLDDEWDSEDDCGYKHSNSIVFYNNEYGNTPTDILEFLIEALNHYRKMFLETKDKKYWWYMIQLLPSSYNQKRTVQLNYQVLKNMYHARKNHKLDEWHKFCEMIEDLPYSELITNN
jgi:hypothetical protein